MTAEEFLRDLAKRVEVAKVIDKANNEDDEDYIEEVLIVRLDPYDAEEFLSLTGVRVE